MWVLFCLWFVREVSWYFLLELIGSDVLITKCNVLMFRTISCVRTRCGFSFACGLCVKYPGYRIEFDPVGIRDMVVRSPLLYVLSRSKYNTVDSAFRMAQHHRNCGVHSKVTWLRCAFLS